MKFGVIAMWAKVHGITAIASMKCVEKDFEWQDALEEILPAQINKRKKDRYHHWNHRTGARPAVHRVSAKQRETAAVLRRRRQNPAGQHIERVPPRHRRRAAHAYHSSKEYRQSRAFDTQRRAGHIRNLLEYIYPTGLAGDFVVCYIEYRGTGLSYNPAADTGKMTTERYLADVFSISEYLRKRFKQNKLCILDHSFGSRPALKAAQTHPEYYAAYIAMSQSCGQRRSEYLAYDYMKKQYALRGDKKMVKKFENCPIKTSNDAYHQYFTSSLRDTAMHELGVGTTRDMRSVVTGLVIPSLRCTDFTRAERIALWKGKVRSAKFPIVSEAFDSSPPADNISAKIPVHFLLGRYDYTCCYTLQKEFCESLKAPNKEFHTFENSSHSPLFEEPNKARNILREICKQPQ